MCKERIARVSNCEFRRGLIPIISPPRMCVDDHNHWLVLVDELVVTQVAAPKMITISFSGAGLQDCSLFYEIHNYKLIAYKIV